MPSRKTKQNQRVPPRTRKMKGGYVPSIISADVINNPTALAEIIANLGKTKTLGIAGRLTGAKIEADLKKLENMANKLDDSSKIKLYTAIAISMYSDGPNAIPEKGTSPPRPGWAADLGHSAGYKYFVDKTCLPFLRKNANAPSKPTPTPVAKQESKPTPTSAEKSPSTRRRILKKTTRYPTPATNTEPATEVRFPKISKIMDKTVNDTMPVATKEALSGVDFYTLSEYLDVLGFKKDDKTNISNRINLLYLQYPLGKDEQNHYKHYNFNLLSNGKEIIIIAEDTNGDKYNLMTFTKVLLTSDLNGKFMVYSTDDNGVLMAYKCSFEQPQLPATNREGVEFTAENTQTLENTMHKTLANRRSKINPNGVKLSKEQQKNIVAYHNVIDYTDMANGDSGQTQKATQKATHNRHAKWHETTSRCSEHKTKTDCKNDDTCFYIENKTENGKIIPKCWTKKEHLNVHTYPSENEATGKKTAQVQ